MPQTLVNVVMMPGYALSAQSGAWSLRSSKKKSAVTLREVFVDAGLGEGHGLFWRGFPVPRQK
jgi:hypothetical protein